MKKLLFLSLIFILLISQSCQKHDPFPDYASKLVGEFDIAYVIVDLDTKEVMSSDLDASKSASINLKRKSDQYLTATVTINDSTTRLTDTFDLVIYESADQLNTSGKPGFLAKYKVGKLGSIGLSLNDWSLFQDGSIIGTIQYGDDKYIKIFSIGANLN